MKPGNPDRNGGVSQQRGHVLRRCGNVLTQKFRAIDARLTNIPQPLAVCLRLLFAVLYGLAALILILGAALILLMAWLVYGLAWAFWTGERKAVLWGALLAVAFFVGVGMAFHYNGEGETAGALYPVFPNEGKQWLWLRLALASVVSLCLWALMRWLRKPEFNMEAAKGYYMGQSLGNQRETREQLNDIRDRLDH